MPLEVRQRQRNGDGAQVLAVVETGRQRLVRNWTGHWWVDQVVEDPVELVCFPIDRAEELAPLLMEWAIKRKLKG